MLITGVYSKTECEEIWQIPWQILKSMNEDWLDVARTQQHIPQKRLYVIPKGIHMAHEQKSYKDGHQDCYWRINVKYIWSRCDDLARYKNEFQTD